MPIRLPPGAKEEIARRAEAGETNRQITDALGLQFSTVARIARGRRMAVCLPVWTIPLSTMPDLAAECIEALLAAGMTTLEIAKETGYHRATIQRRAKDYREKIGQPLNRRANFTLEEIAEVERRADAGESNIAIARAMNSSDATICRYAIPYRLRLGRARSTLTAPEVRREAERRLLAGERQKHLAERFNIGTATVRKWSEIIRHQGARAASP